MRIFLAVLCLLALTACMSINLGATGASLEKVNLIDATECGVDAAFRDFPFDTGTVHVVANEHGDLHTYALTPCRGGTRICGATGRIGTVARTLDYYVVTDAYRDRTFFLSPGGDGYLKFRGVNRDLAWN